MATLEAVSLYFQIAGEAGKLLYAARMAVSGWNAFKLSTSDTGEIMSQTEPVVFVVDDEEVIAKTLAVILNGSGFYTRPFTDASTVLKEARKMEPNLLISDVSMPGMSGIDLAIEMKRLYPNCKTLLFSGQASTADLLEKAKQDGHDFVLLQKPVHPADLLREIRFSAQ
jgi:FixJ family two-component response regulator